MKCANCRGDNEYTMFEALENIVWYDGHFEWLRGLRHKLEACRTKSRIITMPDDIEWHTEKHTIWMLLVGMFGDWGTSIRSGWIDKPEECARFIKTLCENIEGDEDDNV